MALDHFCTDAVLSPYCQDRGAIFSQYDDPCGQLKRYISYSLGQNVLKTTESTDLESIITQQVNLYLKYAFGFNPMARALSSLIIKQAEAPSV